MPRQSTQVFTSNSSDTDSTVVMIPDGVCVINVVLSGSGTWTNTLKVSADGGTTYVNVDTDNAQWTASGTANVEVIPGQAYKLTQSGSSGASVDAWIIFVTP